MSCNSPKKSLVLVILDASSVYRMVSEGRSLRSVQHGPKRVDLVLIDNGDTVLPAHAVDLLVCGSKDEMHEHWRRAVDVYQKLYTYGNVPCTIQVNDQRQKVQGAINYMPCIVSTLRSRGLAVVLSCNPTPWSDIFD